MPSVSDNNDKTYTEERSIRDGENHSISLKQIGETLDMLAKHVEIGCM
jgi:hypothetical protein